MSETETKATPARDPRALSTEYHKAHKQLMLWAAILFVWELVGIDLEQAKSTDGYAGAIVKSIKSPQAVPWVLLLLVFYFLCKCTIEWAQCSLERRKILFARIDFISGLLISCAAILLYVGQAISRVQFANAVSQQGRLQSVSGGLALGVSLIVIPMIYQFLGMYSMRRNTLSAWAMKSILAMPALIALVLPIVRWRTISIRFFMLGLVITVAVGGLPLLITMRRIWRLRNDEAR